MGYYVNEISKKIPTLTRAAVESIVASEWYHPGLTANAVWCNGGCGDVFSLARRLEANFEAIRHEVDAFWRHSDSARELQGVGQHTTQFDKHIAGNGTWVDVRLWRGRAFNRHLCERHFRTVCAIVEASPEVWTNPWSHVLLSVLRHDSWVPFHQGLSNGQLTYHLPVAVPSVDAGVGELAVIKRAGVLKEDVGPDTPLLFEHPEESVSRWRLGETLVLDDSFTHAVRFRASGRELSAEALRNEARVVLLMRAWHPELGPEERLAVREFVRRGGEEHPEGYELLPLPASVFKHGAVL